jgi:ATP-dependent Clp protease ATP-binding subunit ClpA
VVQKQRYRFQYCSGGFASSYQQRLENSLAAELLADEFTNGDKIKINADAHKFTFEKIGTA